MIWALILLVGTGDPTINVGSILNTYDSAAECLRGAKVYNKVNQQDDTVVCVRVE